MEFDEHVEVLKHKNIFIVLQNHVYPTEIYCGCREIKYKAPINVFSTARILLAILFCLHTSKINLTDDL